PGGTGPPRHRHRPSPDLIVPMSDPLELPTRLLHVAEGAAPGARPLTTPIYATSTFVFDSAADLQAHLDAGADTGTFMYSRYANPSLTSLEAKVASAEQGEAALVFGSGMGAISSTLIGLLSAGD